MHRRDDLVLTVDQDTVAVEYDQFQGVSHIFSWRFRDLFHRPAASIGCRRSARADRLDGGGIDRWNDDVVMAISGVHD
jgi:hypothetical protein